MPTPSKTPKGARYAIEVCCAAWIDLLGYGAMLREAKFDPTSSAAALALSRLDNFQVKVASAATKYSTALIINDGAVICRDLSARSTSVTYDFIRRVYNLHNSINEEEQKNGFPGARCVLAAGFRLRRKNHGRDQLLTGYGQHLIDLAQTGTISIEEGIKSAITVKPFVAAMPEAQANFAFTKAYLVDASGSRAGFSGNRLFVDTSLFSRLPDWLSIGETLSWSSEGMSANFFEVKAINGKVAGKMQYDGVLDAHGVAEKISHSPDVIDRLRRTRLVAGTQ